ncbi:hypothetical protein BDY19DRAFT_998767 [Irpex rosettiformis]|uniref:Uncharacterized protein n=1 Tax=Irpex rosettiformis TaxID=378272 RepID=A0ACB8TML7_9APHY|nr:hypothetical protein BDY19DRAFT_998767 [Irpex rosettiformis]
MAGSRSSTRGRRSKTNKGRQRDRRERSNDDSDKDKSPTMASRQKQREVPEVVIEPLTPRRRRQLRREARAFVDDEAQEDNEGEKSSEGGEVDEEEEADKAFIDDSSQPDDEDIVPETDIVSMVPPPRTPKGKGRARVSPESDKMASDSDEEDIQIMAKPSKGKGAEETESDNKEDIEIITPSKRSGRVTVKYVNKKIGLAGKTGKEVMTVPISPDINDPSNPFLNDERLNLPSSVKPKNKRSPHKKAKLTEDDEAKLSSGDVERPDPVQETPVSKISRKMRAHTLEIDDPLSDPLLSTGKARGKSSAVTPSSSKIEDQVSNVNDPEHLKFMCKWLLDTYSGPSAPPVISVAQTILNCHNNKGLKTMISFRGAMKFLGFRPDSPQFKLLKEVTIQATFGRFVYNLSRVDSLDFEYKQTTTTSGHKNSVYRCLRNLSNLEDFDSQDYICFAMFGTVVDSSLEESYVLASSSRDRPLYQRNLVILPLSMELQRALNTLANIWNVESIGISARNGGATFATMPSSSPYPQENLGGGTSHSPRKRKPSERQLSSSSEDEPDLRLPSRSLGGSGKPTAGGSTGNPEPQFRFTTLPIP